ncbi:MAG: hypothetical protein KF785_01420 [Gemmatimonadales bacterium]|nr:hypothetical protein [Gemmatimonadales bacterium]
MAKHPTIEIPNIGPMDHAWDVLGEWNVDFEIPSMANPIAGTLVVDTWMQATIELEPWGAAVAGLPEKVSLERASRVHLTDAGGGALQWVYVSEEDRWTMQATMWPGSLHLFVQDVDDPNQQLYRAVGYRTGDYYSRKYPLVAR